MSLVASLQFYFFKQFPQQFSHFTFHQISSRYQGLKYECCTFRWKWGGARPFQLWEALISLSRYISTTVIGLYIIKFVSYLWLFWLKGRMQKADNIWIDPLLHFSFTENVGLKAIMCRIFYKFVELVLLFCIFNMYIFIYRNIHLHLY